MVMAASVPLMAMETSVVLGNNHLYSVKMCCSHWFKKSSMTNTRQEEVRWDLQTENTGMKKVESPGEGRRRKINRLC